MSPPRIERPTLIVAAMIAAGFAAVLLGHRHLPLAVEVVVLALLGAWYNSLQHEVIHGHPTPWPPVNTAMVSAPLGLLVPFAVYRDTHLAHHRSPAITDPDHDPESFHVTPQTWARCGPVRRAGLRTLRTLAGRMVLGPPIVAVRTGWRGVVTMRTPAGVVRALTHVGAVVAVLAVVHACGLPIWVYVLGVAWGGGALSLLRSFAEHRVPEDGTRSAVVRAGRLMSLLYLNNNLHHTHHARPGVPWFALPACTPSSTGTASPRPEPGSIGATARSPAATCSDPSATPSTPPRSP